MAFIAEPTLAEIVDCNMFFVRPDDDLSTVIDHMSSNHVSHVLVGDKNQVRGIIEQYQLVRIADLILQNPNNAQLFARDMMNPMISYFAHDCTISQAIEHMQKAVFATCVVTQDDTILGVITPQQLTLAYARLFKHQSQYLDQKIHSETAELRKTNQELVSLSLRDPLLGIGNRRAMEASLKTLHANAIEQSSTYSLILFDADYFKQYNDCYGHLAGDTALKRLTEMITRTTRNNDLLFRFGGEELLLALPRSSKHVAISIGQRIIENVMQANITHNDSPFYILTLSAGITTFDPKSLAANESAGDYLASIEAADIALYTAKNEGKNCLRWQEIRNQEQPQTQKSARLG